MSGPSNQKLNEALQQWADSHTPSTDELEALHARISTALRDDELIGAVGRRSGAAEDGDFDLFTTNASPSTASQRIVWFALGIAASLLVMVAIRLSASPDSTNAPGVAGQAIESPPPSELLHDDIPSFAVLGKQDLAEKMLLFKTAHSDFDRQLHWIAESNGHIELGLGPAGQTAGVSGQPLALRLVLVSRRTGDSAWQTIWSKDVIARNETPVDKIPGAGKLHVWCYALPDGLIAVESELTLQEPFVGRYVFSGVQKPGATQRILALEIGGVEYALFQTVSALDDFAAESHDVTVDGSTS